MKILKLRRGPKARIPMLHEAELAYTSDTNELTVGTSNGNTTPTFDGGLLTDSTKGRLILRHGTTREINDLKPGELFYLEDIKSLAIGLENNAYTILNQVAALEDAAIQQQEGE